MFFDLRKKAPNLSFSVRNYDDIYFDTCALLEEGFRSCLRTMIPELVRTGKRIVIPYPVMQELSYLCAGVTSTCCYQAQRAKALILKLTEVGLTEYAGKPENSEQADHYFVKAVSGDQFCRKIAIVTQDRQLTEDIHLLNRINSARANPVHTYKLEKGTLVRTQARKEHDII